MSVLEQQFLVSSMKLDDSEDEDSSMPVPDQHFVVQQMKPDAARTLICQCLLRRHIRNRLLGVGKKWK